MILAVQMPLNDTIEAPQKKKWRTNYQMFLQSNTYFALRRQHTLGKLRKWTNV